MTSINIVMPSCELLEQCRLTDKELQLAGQEYEDSDHLKTSNEYILDLQILKAYSIICREMGELNK